MSSLNIAVVILLISYSSGQPLSEIEKDVSSSSSSSSESDEIMDGEKYEICAGCASDASKNEKIKELVNATLLEFDTRSNHTNKYKLNVIKATQQVVSGMLYDIEAWLVLTDCSKNATTEVELCKELEEPKQEKCEIIIWERVWLAQRRHTDVQCETIKFNLDSDF